MLYRSNFNSTMVRLEAGLKVGCAMILIFQFHYGTIRRDSQGNYSAAQTSFQFHYGTIRRATPLEGTEHQWISIPLWYD